VQQLLCHGGYCELILSLARTSCRLRPTARPLAGNPLRDVVRSRNPTKSTLAHDAVATAVLHKHHPIIRVGAGLIQFVYRSHLRLATEATRNRNVFSPFSARAIGMAAGAKGPLECAVLIACSTEKMGRLLCIYNVPYVICWKTPVQDETAKESCESSFTAPS